MRRSLTGRADRGVNRSVVVLRLAAEHGLLLAVALSVVHRQSRGSGRLSLLPAQRLLFLLVKLEPRTTETRARGSDQPVLALAIEFVSHSLHVVGYVLLGVFERFHQIGRKLFFVFGDERDRRAFLSRSTGSSDAVHVIF